MSVQRIPGVGPTNADIASTIATTPAVSAQITANVPTAAAIASAVAAPSSATIQSLIQTYAASAGVTMAAITSSITANAASAGVTIAAITAAGNSAGWGTTGGETWTLISTQNGTSGNTLTFSSLSGYKKYKLAIDGISAGANRSFTMRVNGLTTNYYWGGWYGNGAVNGSSQSFTTAGNAGAECSLLPTSVWRITGTVIFEQANITGVKTWKIFTAGVDNSGFPFSSMMTGSIQGLTAAINSIAFQSSSTMNGGSVSLYGGN